MFMAYSTRPTVVEIGTTGWWKVIDWKQLGVVADMEEAKRRFGGSPVLERL